MRVTVYAAWALSLCASSAHAFMPAGAPLPVTRHLTLRHLTLRPAAAFPLANKKMHAPNCPCGSCGGHSRVHAPGCACGSCGPVRISTKRKVSTLSLSASADWGDDVGAFFKTSNAVAANKFHAPGCACGTCGSNVAAKEFHAPGCECGTCGSNMHAPGCNCGAC